MLTRRDMFKAGITAGSAAILGMNTKSHAEESCSCCNAIYSKILGWRIGPQIYSFRLFPFDEAVKKVKATGAASFELYGGQSLSKDCDEKIGPGMSKEAKKRFRDLLAENGVVPHSMGVCGADRAHFEFAVENGFSVINVEPDFDALPEVSKLAEEYKVNVGLHNHPKPSRYWDPSVVLEHLADCSTRIGACCDTAHWLRSELDPLECVKKFNGRISSFHIKDLNADKGDVPLGQGLCKIADVLKVCADLNVRAPFSIEYESDWENNVPMVTEGIKFFNATARKIIEEA